LIDVETNIKGSIVLFDECVKSKVKKVIFSSSGGAIYGNQNKNKLSENDATNPISPYAISKLAIEKYLEYYRITRGLDYLILRYANPYGPGQNVVGSQGIIPIFLNLIRQGKPITIYGDGKNTRDYIYIDDAIHITKLVFAKKTKYRLYNVGGGKSASINEVVEIMKNVTKNKIKIVRRPSRNLDVRRILLDTKNIKAETGYVPSVSLVSGIRKTWKWLNKE
jgi:UDP-glucose 4-epimerase